MKEGLINIAPPRKAKPYLEAKKKRSQTEALRKK
jgi:hypothetical protein